MATEFTLSYTANEINEKLGKVDNFTLGVHTDGLVYLFANGKPVGSGVQFVTNTGDVWGYVDSAKVVTLMGNLAQDTYTFKYKMANGSLVDIGEGQLFDDPVEPDEPTMNNVTNLFDPSTAVLNKRIKSDGTLVDAVGHVTYGFVDISATIPFTADSRVYIKGADLNSYNGQSYAKLNSYKSKPATGYSGGYSMVNGSTITQTNMGNGVVAISGDNLVASFTTGVIYMAMTLRVKDTEITADDIKDIVVTINEPIYKDDTTYTNLLPLSTNADGTPYVGDNGEKGYKEGYRIKSSGEEAALSGAYCSGFIPVTTDDTIYITPVVENSNAVTCAIALYDANKTKVFQSAFSTTGYSWCTVTDGVYSFELPQMSLQTVAYFRFSCASITDETIVTVNEPIV